LRKGRLRASRDFYAFVEREVPRSLEQFKQEYPRKEGEGDGSRSHQHRRARQDLRPKPAAWPAWTRAVAGDEEAGTLDLVLAHPVSRTRLALHRFGALCTSLLAIGVVLWLAMLAITGPDQLGDITAGEFPAATGRKALAVGVASGVTVLAYLANGTLPQVEGLEWTRSVSPWHWMVGGEPLKNGLQVGDTLLLLGTAVVIVGWARGRSTIAT
jgi:hypothetical protein